MKMKSIIQILIGASLICGSFAANAEIPNFHQVNSGIFRGGRPTSEADMGLLKASGIKTIINLQGGDLKNPLLRKFVAKLEPGELPQNINAESSWAKAAGIQFFNFPLDSIGDVTKKENVEIESILSILNDEKYFPVFVHCEHGKDRTGMIISLYKVQNTSIGIHAAHEEWESYGHEEINSLFTRHLDTYFYKKAIQLRYLSWSPKK